MGMGAGGDIVGREAEFRVTFIIVESLFKLRHNHVKRREGRPTGK
jgi:hypothetical protein